MPVPVLLLVGGAALAFLALRKSSSAPTPPTPTPGPTAPGVPGVPGVGPGAVIGGCQLDSGFPASLAPSFQEAMTRPDMSPVSLLALSQGCQAAGYTAAATCLSQRAAVLAAQQGSGQPQPSDRPPWYPATLPWPVPLPWQPPAGGGWGPRPAGYPASWPWPPFGGAQPPAPGGNEVPPYVPGDLPPSLPPTNWGPRPAGYPAAWPWPPFGSPTPTQNPAIGDSIELQTRPGDTPAGFAAYYSGHGPGYQGAELLPDVDMGPLAQSLATLAAQNPGHYGAGGWKAIPVGSPFYVPRAWVEVRGIPPLATGIYQSAGGFVPRADQGLDLGTILGGVQVPQVPGVPGVPGVPVPDASAIDEAIRAGREALGI